MVKREINENELLNNRVNKIIGQLNGINKMINEYRPCQDIIIQIAAVTSATKSLGQELLKNHMHTCMKKDILDNHDEAIDEVVDLMKRLG